MTPDDPPLPPIRPRRLRRLPGLRRMARETTVRPEDLVLPLFVDETIDRPAAIESMPGVHRHPVEGIADAARDAAAVGVPAVLLFGIPRDHDDAGSPAWDPDGVIPRAVRAIHAAAPALAVITDVCLCEYTAHGHCGVPVRPTRPGIAIEVDNDATLPLLARVAVAHADAGADVVAPSDMMDGRVAAIRTALDRGGHADVAILSYAAKYASALYGPFRDAAGSAPREGDRRGYQMDPANAREAVREVALDIDEGADIVMVKPALACLDIVRAVRDRFDVPLAAYNVSGEFAMVKAAAARGWLDERAAVMEITTALRRAGADIVISYWATDIARWTGGPD